MTILPKTLTKSLFVSLLSFLFLFMLVPQVLASSAYVSPTSGLITVKNFKVSFYVESTSNEPEIAGANLKISYPTGTVKVVSVNDGEFDSYLEKNDDATLGVVSINAVNNAGNYKSGKVKLASVEFEALSNSGQVQLTISSDSEISGVGGEQLLTETINGVYNLSLSEDTTTGSSTGEQGSPAGTEETPAETTPVPETGGGNLYVYLFVSIGLIAVGLGALSKQYSNS